MVMLLQPSVWLLDCKPTQQNNFEWYTTTCLQNVFIKVRGKRTRGCILERHDNALARTANKTKSFLASEKIDRDPHTHCLT